MGGGWGMGEREVGGGMGKREGKWGEVGVGEKGDRGVIEGEGAFSSMAKWA